MNTPLPLKTRCSSLPTVRACAASLVLDDVAINSSTPEADLGTAFHLGQAMAIQGKPLEPLELSRMFGVNASELELLLRLGWQAWESIQEWFPNPRCEVGLLSDLDPELHLSGTSDLLSESGEEARICDWKTGRFFEADHEWQLRGYGYLGLLNRPHLQRARVCLVHVRDLSATWGVFTREELDKWWEQLKARTREREQYSPGRHCTFCPRSATCVARTALLRQAAQWLPGFPEQAMPTDELSRGATLAGALSMAKVLEDACATVRETVRVEVANAGGSLPIGNGKELRLEAQTQRIVKPSPDTAGIIAEYVDPASRWACYDVTKGRLEELVKVNAPKRRGAATVREMYERLEAIGAIETKTVERLEVRTLKAIEEKHE